MKVLVTGGKGFIGQNLVIRLQEKHEVFSFDVDSDTSTLEKYIKKSDFTFHLAGVNRPTNPCDFYKGNVTLTETIIELIEANNLTTPLLFSSTTQVGNGSDYAKSKELAEKHVSEFAKRNGSKVYIYQLPGVFGKWCRPNYNSVVATFCHNIARDLPITVNDPRIELTLTYIDDITDVFMKVLEGDIQEPVSYKVTLGSIVQLLESFRDSRNTLSVPTVSDSFSKKLHATYLSYLPKDHFSYPLKMNFDERGSFTEILRTIHHGQFSVNIIKPNIVKGNHWHHTKNEKFLVVSGEGVIRFRNIKPFGENEILEYHVSGKDMEVVDIPPGYTHNIANTGNTDLVTFMWCNEPFNPDRPDTIFLEV